ncbi:MAG TPA: hypothetical protein VE891_07640 [Allosphingosinicella sp.]|nr:hypothetical protein [Allosphingosinicella sp.]
MSSIFEEIRDIPEVDPVFRFRFALDLSDEAPSHHVDIECLAAPVETRKVVLNISRPTSISLAFGSGYQLNGDLTVLRWGDRGGGSIGVDADLRYSRLGQLVVQHFRGLMFRRDAASGPTPDPPGPMPPDPPWPEPGQEDQDEPSIAASGDELFPYLYIRNWPKISAEELRFGFFGYVPASPPSSNFVTALAAARAGPGPRPTMEALAVSFIEGAAPYSGIFVAGRSDLPGPLADYAALARQSYRPGLCGRDWLDRLRAETTLLLGRNGKSGAYLSSAGYVESLDRAWQSYFALVVLLGYDPALLQEIGLTLWLANAVKQGLKVGPEGKLSSADLTESQCNSLAHASLRLPANLFPLPPADQASPPTGTTGWIEPFAVGDLQMVRQRLVRYSAGEIARIENVIRGERREASSRQGRREVESRERTAADEQYLETESGDERTDLIEETGRTVAGKSITDGYADLTANYGPPTQGTFNGSRTRVTLAGAPGAEDVTRFAREVLSATVSRISRRVGTLRSSSKTSHAEDAVVSVIDNSAGGSDVCAVYRWLNKIYEACVVNYGNRLMMEFIVPVPGARFRDHHAKEERRGLAPPPLVSPGINSFKDINDANYASLCATYGVTDIEPPPPPSKVVAAVLRDGEETQIAIPPGYWARTASAACVTTPPGLTPPPILVGCRTVAAGATVSLDPLGQDLSVPVAVAKSAGRSASPPDAPSALVNVEIGCEPTRNAMDQWRIDIYRGIVAAHRESMELRREESQGAPPRRSPLACREIEKRALRNSCTRMLLDRAASLASGTSPALAASPPSTGEFAEPRFLQFIDQALEWREMSYTLVSFDDGRDDDAEGGSEGDALFDRFAHARQARVLVPAAPDRVLSFLYFFASGMIWDGPDWIVAVNDGEVDVVDDLKRASRAPRAERRVGRPWEVVVPTAMQVLDRGGGFASGGSDLPAAGAQS